MSGGVRGWCPSLFEPMQSGDGLLARVKPPLGRLRADAARALAESVRETGNGELELTNRGALQVRGLSETSLPRLQAAVLAAGLASPDPAVERRRNVVLSPFASDDGKALAAALEAWIAEDESLDALPSKFGFGVAAPELDPRPLSADIAFSQHTDGWLLSVAGGERASHTYTPIAAARVLVRRFLAGSNAPTRRMADLVRGIGAATIFADVGLMPLDAPPSADGGPATIAGPYGEVFALGLPFGAFKADQLDLAAALAEQFADGWLRLSPWRALVLAGVSDPGGLAAAAKAAGFIADAADARLRLSACPGAPACASGHAATRADATALAGMGMSAAVHVSGCAKGCAHPQPAPFTLVARPGGYSLVRGGRASDPAEAHDLTLDQAAQRLGAEAK